MDTVGPILALSFVALFVLLVWAIRAQTRSQRIRDADAIEKEKQEAEEQFNVYGAAWASARVSDNIDALVQCGDYLIKAARRWQPHQFEGVAWDVYKETLSRLKGRPELKPKALEFGRVAYAASRPGGSLTIYDEQAIQNDILAHT